MSTVKRILTASATICALSMWASEQYYIEPKALPAGTVICDTIAARAGSWNYHCRLQPDKSVVNPQWLFVINSDGGFRRIITLNRLGRAMDDAAYVQPIELTMTDMSGKILRHYVVDRDIDGASDAISFILEKNSGTDSVICKVGQRYPLIDFVVSGADSIGCICLEAVSPVELLRLSLLSEGEAHGHADSTFISLSDLNDYLSTSEKPLEKQWRYLDRDTDPRLLNLGGDYALATVSNSDGGYDLLYVSGARVNSGYWRPLMLKGRLKPTPFVNHYDLEWYDAYGRLIDHETNADVENGGSILKLNFPLQGGSVRFAIVTDLKR